MEILRQPDTFTLSTALDTIEVNPGTDNLLRFEIRCGDDQVLAPEIYRRQGDTIRIHGYHKAIEHYLRGAEATVFLLPGQRVARDFTFIYTTDSDEATRTHRVLLCNVRMNISATLFTATHFLTLCEREKRTSLTRTETLAIYNPPADSTVRVEALYLQGDNTVTAGFTAPLLIRPQGESLSIGYVNVSPRLYQSSGKKLLYYIVAHGNKHFRFDIVEQKNEQHFVFRNTFGCEETFTFRGLAESEADYQRAFGYFSGRYRTFDTRNEKKFHANTGPLPQNEAAWIEDLFASTELHLYNSGGLIHELTTLDQDVKRANSPDELPSFDITYRLAADRPPFDAELLTRTFDETFDYTFK